MARVFIEGHAIVSAQGCYADARGQMPAALRFENDWQRFQAALDNASLTVLGRKGHQANAKPANRRRLVVSTRPDEWDRAEPDVHWTRPDVSSLGAALDRLVPEGGRVAVVGGTGVFDLFLSLGYDAFHLVVAARVDLPGGRPVFGGAESLEDIVASLNEHGLKRRQLLEIDRQNGVILHLYWR